MNIYALILVFLVILFAKYKIICSDHEQVVE